MFIMFKNGRAYKLTKETKSLYFKDKEPHSFLLNICPERKSQYSFENDPGRDPL